MKQKKKQRLNKQEHIRRNRISLDERIEEWKKTYEGQRQLKALRK